jgi:acetate---CoA ligase (ADP-forming)
VTDKSSVAAMLGARTMALVGASARPDSLGSRMIVEAQRGSARFHLVNPRYDRIGDLSCAPSIGALDEPVDVALLAVPDAVLPDQVAAAAAAGAGSAVLFGSAHGLRDEITAIATEAGMAICGAGCMGFVNNAIGVRALGYLEPDPLRDGGVSLVTHSGSAFSTLLRARRGFGFRLAVSSGQELVTNTADYVDYALDDPETRIIGLLLETPRDVPRLRAALLRAAEQDVPVVILTVGGSPQGRLMVAAHSGALAGEAAAWQAFCAAAGAIRVGDLAEFSDTLELFSTGRRARPGGIATVHDSGAERALAADLAHELGVEFADLGPDTLAAIDGVLDDGLAATNPLDVWGTGADTRNVFGACLRAMVDDPAVAVTALAVDLVTEFDGDTAYADAVSDVAKHSDGPIAVMASMASAIDPSTAERLRDSGIAVLEGTRSGLAALGHLARWPLSVDRPEVDVDSARQARWATRISGGAPFELLADYGVPVVDVRTADSVTAVLQAADAVGYPVALKTVAAQHKSDVGGVVLGLADGTALQEAYTVMTETLGPAVTVEPMAAAGVEVSVGIVGDPAFGPLVVVAAGGTMVELLADRVVACPPVSAAGGRHLLDGLRIRPLLDGWRGAPAADIDALVQVIVAFSQMAMEIGDVVQAVEANPVIVSPHGAVAVDALLIQIS